MSLVQITAGRGPVEVELFVQELAAALQDHVDAQGGDAAILAQTRGSVQLRCVGVALEAWMGTHELVHAARGRGQRRRWFCAIHPLEEPVLQGFDEQDVVITTSRAGGPGGQHVNTTSSAVRAVHPPTGLSVRVVGQRSQHQNRAEALRLLRARWVQLQRGCAARREHAARSAHDAVVRGRPVMRWQRCAGRLVLRCPDGERG